MKGYRTKTHDILIEFEGDGLALADEVRKLRGVLAEAKRVKPFDWDGDETFAHAAILVKHVPAVNKKGIVKVWNDGQEWAWEIDSAFFWHGEKCNSLLDGKMKAFEAWSKWLGQFLEEVEL